MLDLKIIGGAVIDGTGAPRRITDVGVVDGRIVRVGTIDDPARRTIDATGLVVAPGFVDPHTHYDAQVMWDGTVSPSPLYGVTTIVGGNCGFTLAPISPNASDYVMRMLACVEGMPVEALEAALDWDWRGFGDWLDRLEGTLAINAGFLTGHSTLRRLVLGQDHRRPATDENLASMAMHLEAALDAGALGFSSSLSDTHADHLGEPVPSRYAAPSELLALARVLSTYTGSSLELVPTAAQRFSDELVALMTDLSLAAQAPLNWNLLTIGPATDEASVADRLRASDHAAAKGAAVVALTPPIPTQLRLNLRTSIVYHQDPTWSSLLGWSVDDCVRRLGDAGLRDRLEEAAAAQQHRSFFNFEAMTVESTGAPELGDFVGRTLGTIAAERGTTPVQAFLDLAIADRLRLCVVTAPDGTDETSWRRRREVWDDPRAVVGGSDAGAHVDMLAAFGYFADLVGPSVRERGLLSLEQAVHLLTDVPARLLRLVERGRLVEGWVADLVLFDPEAVGPGQVTLTSDLPGGASRLNASPTGVERVLVGGQEVVRSGRFTEARPGVVLRRGTHTR